MRHKIGTVLCLIVLATLGLESPPSQGASGWVVFTHPQYGFSLSYPAGWVITRPVTPLLVLSIVGPKSAGSSEFQMNVNVVTDSIPVGTSIEQFDAVANEKLQRIFPGYQLLRTDRTQVGGYPAVLRYTTWHPGVAELYQMQLGVIVVSRLYVVTGTTLAASTRIREEALLLQRILTTFRP